MLYLKSVALELLASVPSYVLKLNMEGSAFTTLGQSEYYIMLHGQTLFINFHVDYLSYELYFIVLTRGISLC